MQYLEFSKDMTLSKLSSIVGERNVDYILNANSIDRSVNIGKTFETRNQQTISDYGANRVDYQTKLNLLNQFVGDSDIFEKAALGSNSDWITLSQYNCFTDAIKIPEEIKLPSSVGLLGNGEPISDQIYQECVQSLTNPSIHDIDPTIFSKHEVSYAHGSYGVTENGQIMTSEPFQWFALPWGEIFLYSSLGDEELYFPVYPEGFDDGRKANYDDMPEMLYQYEPWKVYKSSGPREVSFTFKMHRDMWTGDHRDGNANNLIRGCQANCYPNYDGSLVNVSLVTTDCKVNWDKPIGLDGFYLYFELTFTISEVSPEKLNFKTVRNKGLIS